MSLSALLPLLATPIWVFPGEPLEGEVRRGVEVYCAGKGLERVFQEDRRSIGTWFDGKVRRDVEEALWLCPRLLSRWLGFLEAKEKWPPTEKHRRWQALKDQLEGRFVFAVRLAAFPKMDPLEGSSCGAPSTRDLDEVRWLVTFDGRSLPRRPVEGAWLGWGAAQVQSPRRPKDAPEPHYVEPQTALLARRRASDRSVLEAFAWYRTLPFGEALSPEFSSQDEEPLPHGDYHASWTLLWVDVPDGIERFQDVQVRAFSPSKERIASFGLIR